jgi:hypothetical protein
MLTLRRKASSQYPDSHSTLDLALTLTLALIKHDHLLLCRSTSTPGTGAETRRCTWERDAATSASSKPCSNGKFGPPEASASLLQAVVTSLAYDWPWGFHLLPPYANPPHSG